MGVAVAVVAHRRHVDCLLGGGEVDPPAAEGGGGGRRRLQGGEGLADVTGGQPDQVILGLGGQGECAGQATLVGDGAAQQTPHRLVVQRLQGEQHAPRQQR